MAIHTHYTWASMRDGKLQRGMYTRGDKADSADIARQLAKPIDSQADSYALVRVETRDDVAHRTGEPTRTLLNETIIEIVPRS